MESKGWVMTGGQDHVQPAWPVREQEFQLRLRFRRAQLVQIIDHQQDGRFQRVELPDQAPHQPIAVELRRRLELLHDGVRADRRAEPLDDRQPEALGVPFAALHQDPGRS